MTPEEEHEAAALNQLEEQFKAEEIERRTISPEHAINKAINRIDRELNIELGLINPCSPLVT